MWVNIGVEVVVVRRLCWRAVVPGVSVFVAGPTLRCRVCGAAACRVLPSLGARRRAPNPRTHGWWRSLSGSVWDEAGAGLRGSYGLVVGEICQTIDAIVLTNRYGLDPLSTIQHSCSIPLHTHSLNRIICAHLSGTVMRPTTTPTTRASPTRREHQFEKRGQCSSSKLSVCDQVAVEGYGQRSRHLITIGLLPPLPSRTSGGVSPYLLLPRVA